MRGNVRGACKNVSLAALVIVVLQQSFSYIHYSLRCDTLFFCSNQRNVCLCSQFNASHSFCVIFISNYKHCVMVRIKHCAVEYMIIFIFLLIFHIEISFQIRHIWCQNINVFFKNYICILLQIIMVRNKFDSVSTYRLNRWGKNGFNFNINFTSSDY